jgi:pullulanase-type alpha-1,6-glucosidase
MGHQPRAAMEQVQRRADAAAGHHVPLIGEGWNFGEVADGRRFVQASQLSLNGSGIGTFNDRLRDAVRGGSAGDAGSDMLRRQGYINGQYYDPNAMAAPTTRTDLMHTADLVRAGLAGSLRNFVLPAADGKPTALEHLDYNGQSAGYASAPAEVVNYVENHDNQTLYDINVLKLPRATSTAERARVQMLGAALVAFSQGVAYFHAGVDTLRSKSLDRNSFNSGDWFNRIDWSYRDDYFGSGLPPRADNGKDYALRAPLLADPALKPAARDIAFARDAFRDLLAIRASTSLYHLRSAQEVNERLHFWNTGPDQEPTVIAAHLDGRGYPGAHFGAVICLVNVDKVAHSLSVPEARGLHLRLHTVHATGTDARARAATFDTTTGSFAIPARTAVVFVQ